MTGWLSGLLTKGAVAMVEGPSRPLLARSAARKRAPSTGFSAPFPTSLADWAGTAPLLLRFLAFSKVGGFLAGVARSGEAGSGFSVYFDR